MSMSKRAGVRPLPDHPIRQILRGFAYPFEALHFIRAHRLWGLTAIPIAVNILLLVAVASVIGLWMWPYLAEAVETLGRWWPAGNAQVGDQHGWFNLLVEALYWLGRVLLFVVLGLMVVAVVVVPAALGAAVLLLVGQTVASPFLDILSERVENIVLGTAAETFSIRRVFVSSMMAAADLFWGALYLTAIHVPLLVLGFVPVVGTVTATVVSFCATSLLLAHESIGLPLTRRLVSYQGRWRAVMVNKWLSMGFGGALMVMAVVPLLDLLLLPLVVTGGTLLFCDLQAADRLPSLDRR